MIIFLDIFWFKFTNLEVTRPSGLVVPRDRGIVFDDVGAGRVRVGEL